MRGKVFDDPPEPLFDWITPAYAGKSFSRVLLLWINQDHPRLCGEKNTCTHAGNFIEGSPPPMRGKVAQIIYVETQHRITPAYAGKR